MVGDAFCDTYLLGVIEPENELLCTKLLMDFEAVIRRVTSYEADQLLEDDDIIPRLLLNRTSIELDSSNSSSMEAAISDKLGELHVPLVEHSHMVKRILVQASEAAQKSSSYASGKVILHMSVKIDLYVIDDDDDDDTDGGDDIIGDYYYDPRFVPASKLSIETLLKRTRAQVSSTVCSVCMEEIRVGSEETQMPCSHLYHECCIVEWLQKSGVCPLCKFRMPSDQ